MAENGYMLWCISYIVSPYQQAKAILEVIARRSLNPESSKDTQALDVLTQWIEEALPEPKVTIECVELDSQPWSDKTLLGLGEPHQ